MPSELVSVIIPTYNRRHCIGNALESVLAQTHTEWEAVIVDDGSTDGTGEWIAERYGHERRIRYFYQRNSGVSKARNTALAHAEGDFVAFLDSDDLWKPWKLEVQLACLRQFPELGMVWTNMEAIGPDGAVTDPAHLRTMYSAYSFFPTDTLFSGKRALAMIEGAGAAPDQRAFFFYGDIYPSMIQGNLVHTSTAFLRRSRLERVRGFDETLGFSGEDYDFHLRTCQWGPVGLIDLAAIQYQKGQPDQLTKHTRLIAQNFLKTVQNAVTGEAGHRFDRRRVNRVIAEANGWIAEEDFKAHDGLATRHHAWQALRRQPFRLRLWLLLTLSGVPRWTLEPILHGFRALKHSRRRA